MEDAKESVGARMTPAPLPVWFRPRPSTAFFRALTPHFTLYISYPVLSLKSTKTLLETANTGDFPLSPAF